MNKSADSISITLAHIGQVKKKIKADWGILSVLDVIAFILGFAGVFAVLFGLVLANIYLAWSGTVSIFLALALIPLYLIYSRQAARAYDALFENFEFATPTGEEVKFLASDNAGHFVTVRFDDGYELQYPLGALKNKAGQFHEFGLEHISSVGYTKSLSKVKWRDPAGKTGIVRKVITGDHSGIVITLKFDDGQIAECPIWTLEPVPVPPNAADARLSLLK